MILNYNGIKNVTCGATDVTEENGKIKFSRFTDEERDFYKYSDLLHKTYASAGVKLDFITDGEEVGFNGEIATTSSRTFFGIDILVNGKLVDSICTSEKDGDVEKVSGTVSLSKGEKRVTVYFPWSKSFALSEFSLKNATFVRPVKYEKTAIFYGDSITQGYDVIHPFKHYTHAVGEYLNAEIFNKAIGAEVFCPDLIKKANKIPDYVFVAYGTNDFSKTEKDVFERDSAEFYDRICTLYKNSKVFAITPTWRKDYLTENHGYSFEYVRKYITDVAKRYKNTFVIDGNGLVPHDGKYFSDGYLHPNEDGFTEYSENMIKALKNLGIK